MRSLTILNTAEFFLFGNICFAVSLFFNIIQLLYDSIYTDQSVEIGILDFGLSVLCLLGKYCR